MGLLATLIPEPLLLGRPRTTRPPDLMDGLLCMVSTGR